MAKKDAKKDDKKTEKKAAKKVTKKVVKKKTVAKPAKAKKVTKKAEREVEKAYPESEFVAKLRRLADAIENGKTFKIQVAGERVYVPVRAVYNIEHERQDGEEEIEFQIKWSEKKKTKNKKK